MSAPFINFAVTVQLSLADAPPAHTLSAALNWIQVTLFGSVATGIAVIAIASLGFSMLSGRMALRRCLTILLGCFILFGASSLARGLLGFVERESQPYEKKYQESVPVFAKPDNSLRQTIENSYDPYAGAAVQR